MDVSTALATWPGDVAVRRSRWGSGELWIRLATVAAVVTVALIAGAVSYRHMAGVAREHGEDRVTAAIVPISVDGLIVAASLTLLADSRAGRRRSPLPYALLALASAASIAANVMHAEVDLAARLIAAWPSAALIGSYEMLMNQIRKARPRPAGHTSTHRPGPGSAQHLASSRAHSPGSGHDDSPGGTTGRSVDRQRDFHGRQHAEPTTTGRDGAKRPEASDPPRSEPTPPTENAAVQPSTRRDVPWPDSATAWNAAPEPIPPAVLTRALRTARRGSKRARLAAVLLRDVAPGDPRTDYALARDLGPVINLHAGTARRYLAEWRRQATAQPAAA
ncbi:hypothetical protein BCD48_37785 [Pseudofrankia sp. BMG5.36]|nr:hypothetical protein BCD48_37785 [Pseudofrankia sp. BMG5.36]